MPRLAGRGHGNWVGGGLSQRSLDRVAITCKTRYPIPMLKQSVLAIWIGSIAAMLFGSGWVATAGQWAFGLTFLAHVVEFFVYRSLFQRAGGSMFNHLVQTLIYGLFHWTPIKQRLESEAANSPADG